MGVITNCCTRESIIQNSQISLYSKSDEDIFNNMNNKIKEISLIKESIENPFKFIISSKFYSLILAKKHKDEIFYKISKNKKIKEILILMYDLLQFIKETATNEKKNKKIISIKNNAQFSFGYLLKEMKEKNYEDKNDYLINKSLINMCLIIQSILYLKNESNENNNNDDIYKENFWKNKDIVNETKKNGYQGAFFLLLYKNRKNELNFNLNNENSKYDNFNLKIKEELKTEINQYYKLSTNFCNDLLNC